MMDTYLKLSVVVRTPETKNVIEQTFGDVDRLELRFHEAPFGQLGAKIANGSSPDVLLVDIDPGSETEIEALAAYLAAQQQKTVVIATSADGSLATARRLMRMGIVDYVPQPLDAAELRSALEAARQKLRGIRAGNRPRGRIISVMKTQGGAGATTLAVQSAVAAVSGLSKKGKKNGVGTGPNEVCLLDLDLQSGNAGLYLDLKPNYSVIDLIAQPERLDESLLRGAVAEHESGVHLLAAPTELVPMDALNGEDVRRLFSVVRHRYDYAFVDLPQAWMTWTTTALRESDMIVMVTQLSVAAVQQTRRRLEALRRLGAGDVPLCLVANRHVKRGLFGNGFDIKEVETALGRKIDYFIGSDFNVVNEALNLGVPLSELSKGKRVEKDFRRFFEFAMNEMTDQSGVPVVANGHDNAAVQTVGSV